ncbi:DUF4164 family protein [Dethiobacter alkaliphilus]|uniref:t-SNARE coiled-coil homology domain-containing protein n=1 Tax=Dethiobacter alkaliphilus AHT 1 TaxID=555088 RepID=C0GJN6_DETAL|nr:DUF4164 family protein [Dethiobacter alkaliphilus]EEG76458.1 hypothetical protein DealDRAFT_2695 [Dethiobacter alkaliphilus AHT 1]
MEQILNQILDKIDGLESSLGGRIDKLDARMDRLEGRMDRLEGQMDKLEGRMDQQDSRMDRLEHAQAAMSRKVDYIYEETAGLLEFKTATVRFQEETVKTLQRHETDIELLKKIAR